MSEENTIISLQGLQGIQGLQGTQGIQGFQGIQGAQGKRGERGLQGLRGAQGLQGIEGPQGLQGAQGIQGIQGVYGCQGPTGAQGSQGERGQQGPTGAKGAQGFAGERGQQGERGVQGAQGIRGEKGYMGYRGQVGEVGIQGLQGEKGHIWVDGISLDGYNTHLFRLNGNKFVTVDYSKLSLNNGAKMSFWLDQNVYDYLLENECQITVEDNAKITVDGEETLQTTEVTSTVYYANTTLLTDIINIEKDLNTVIELTYYNQTWYYSGGLIGSTNTSITPEYVGGKDIKINEETNAIDIALDKDITTNVKIGFLEINQTLTAGMTLSQILERIMTKEIGAKITKPQVTISTTVNNNREVGTALGTVTFDVNYTDGYYSSADTSIYTATQFNQQNNTTNGKLFAECAEGDYTLYYNINNIVSNTVGQNINTYTDNEIKMEPVAYKFSLKQEYDESMVNTVKTNIGNNTDVNIPSGTANSNELGINFYYNTNVINIPNVIWDESDERLENNETHYKPEEELSNSMLLENGGSLLMNKTQYSNNEYTVYAESSLAIIIPKDKTFNVHMKVDATMTNLFSTFKKYSTINKYGVEYDIYIYPNNNTSADMVITGLTYNI